MKRQLLSALMLMAAVLPAMAEERTEAEMQAIARQQWGAQVKAFGQHNVPTLSRVYADAAVAVFTPETGEGFVIVSRDDRMRPVLGVAAGAFDAQKMPCGMKAWMASINRQLETLNAASAAAEGVEGEEEVEEEEIEEEEQEQEFEAVEPMLTTKWGQQEPFNKLVPMDGDYPVAGCVAVTMAQVLNFHQWPASAAFEGHYVAQRFGEDENGSPIGYWQNGTEDINTTYQWPYKDYYNFYVPEGSTQAVWADRTTEEEDKQVATLMRDCGLAVNMYYQSMQASAALPSAASALAEKFQYAPGAVRYLEAKYFTSDEWEALLYRELQSGCPVIYGANDNTPGNVRNHAFVVHGITPDGLYNVNWGWYGQFDGEYALNALNVEENEDHTAHYSDDHTMIIGIRKEAKAFDSSTPQLSAESYTFTYTPNKSNQTLQATLTNCYNASIQSFTGRLYIAIEDVESGEPWYGDIFNQDIALNGIVENQIYGWQTLTVWPAAIPTFVNGHTYRVYLAYKDVKEGVYQPLRVAQPAGPICFTLEIDAQGNGTLSEAELLEEYLVTTGVRDVKLEGVADDGITRVYDLQGRLIHTAPTASFNLWDVKAHGVLVVKQGDKVRKVAR